MPRKAPTQVIEQRITFGTYERQFVTEVKNDIEKSVKVAAVTAVAAPALLGVSIAAGAGLLGYGLYRGMDAFGFGSDVTETLGCVVRKYAIRMMPFGLGYLFIDDCDLAQKKHDENSAEANEANERKRQKRRDEEAAAEALKEKYGDEEWWGGGGGDF